MRQEEKREEFQAQCFQGCYRYRYDERQEAGGSIYLFVLANHEAAKIAEGGARRMQSTEGKTGTAIVQRDT